MLYLSTGKRSSGRTIEAPPLWCVSGLRPVRCLLSVSVGDLRSHNCLASGQDGEYAVITAQDGGGMFA